jgi:hypothetical protein
MNPQAITVPHLTRFGTEVICPLERVLYGKSHQLTDGG